MKALSEVEIRKLLAAKLENWSYDGTYLSRIFKFGNFVTAFSFMTSVALIAEKMDHHPDWNNIYNSVTIKLNTHDAKGVTELDFDLALAIDTAFESYTSV